MGRFYFQPLALVGISIQPENIHLVQLKKAQKTYSLQRMQRYPLPGNVFSAGKVVGFDQLQAVLARIVKEERLNVVQAAVCVPGNQVRMQHLTMPEGLSEIDMEAEITAQAARALGKGESLCIDFAVQQKVSSGDVDVFYAAARSEYVQRYASCLRAAGLPVALVDVDVFALLRGARHALKDVVANHEKFAVLYFGCNYGVIAAQCGTELIFQQQWDGQGISDLAMTLMQWVAWWSQAYRQAGITSLALGGCQDQIYQAAKIISAEWSCSLYEVDPFAQMAGAGGIDASVSPHDRSAYLLACGLAMREPLPWLK